MAGIPTKEKIRQLADEHIRRYTARIEQAQNGAKYVNVLQTAHYLDLWRNIEKKGCKWDALSNSERGEVVEAIASEA